MHALTRDKPPTQCSQRPRDGSADAEAMARLRRCAALAERRSLKKVLGSITFRLRASQQALFPASRDVQWARQHSGKGALTQRWERLAIALFLRMEPDVYYLFCLHDKERYARSGEFVSVRQVRNLLAYLEQRVPLSVRETLEDKARFHAFCCANGLPTPPVLDTWRPGGAGFALGESAAHRFRGSRDVFFKPVRGLCGEGTGVLSADAGDRWSLRTNHAEAVGLTWAEVFEHFTETKDELLFQPKIVNHRALRKLGGRALLTIRVATFRLSGRITPQLAFLKIAQPGAIADNFSQGSIAVHVDLASGRLGPGALKAHDSPPGSLDAVPVTAERFAGLTLPFWPEVLALACRLHALMQAFPSLAHDIAITDAGPMIVEANQVWGSDGFQKGSDVGLGRSRLPELIAEHFNCD